MKLRDFKKEVEYAVGDFVDDCSLFLAVSADKTQDKVADLLNEAVDLYNDMKDKANRKFEPNADKKAARKERKEWFDALHKELAEKTDALFDKLSAAVSSKEAE